ncbi:hypothetical protein SAMN05216355_10159 [Actinomyces ruminicola]|uniref:Transcriptional regulator, AbiEi antitoxin, Type IV TA system n=1 Tax=Actinomyces ruminicola TaxID=332524 RepID=A0A1G9Z8U8_9ACTO|nr:hypothetical protein [Actinomyces ruminicola]SDN17567.1 hypothetical protein SAMN05216355_10159 [Actinomyces ruminicola]
MQYYPMPPPLPPMTFTSERTRRSLRGRDDLIAVDRGAYVQPPDSAAPLWSQQQYVTLARCEAVLHAHRSAISLTHEAAAAVQGLAVPSAEPDIRVAVTHNHSRSRRLLPQQTYAQGTRRHSGRRVAAVRSTTAPAPSDVHVVGGLRVTTPLRTAMDCAFDLPALDAIVVVDSALRAVCRPDRFTGHYGGGLSADTAIDTLKTMIERQGPRAGKQRARAVAAIADPRAESPGESVLRGVVHAVGLPAPEVQERWADDGEMTEYFLDLAWPEYRLALEFDGYGKYRSAEDLRNEKHREMRLRNTGGWRVHRVEWGDLRDREALGRRLVDLFPPCVARLTRRRKDLWL